MAFVPVAIDMSENEGKEPQGRLNNDFHFSGLEICKRMLTTLVSGGTDERKQSPAKMPISSSAVVGFIFKACSFSWVRANTLDPMSSLTEETLG